MAFTKTRADTADRCHIEELVPVSTAGNVIDCGCCQGKGEPLLGAMLMNVPKEALLGKGTYGIVWRAKHRASNRVFAVKNVFPGQSPTRQHLAARERAVSEQLLVAPHPCLVRLFSVKLFEDIGMTSFVMEFCPGGNLLQAITSCRAHAKRMGLPYEVPDSAHAWIGQVYLGIEHLHRMDLLSRDVKPDNVVLSTDGVAKLTDFGMSRLVATAQQSRWSFGFPAGTLGYCAPEILSQQPHDHRADLYSLGVLVWMLLTAGLTNTDRVTVPQSQPASPDDFEAFTRDCLLLTRCISSPEQHHSRPLPAVARSFLLGLVQREPTDRFGHREIRDHAFMEALDLPATDAATSAVEVWLRRLRKGEVGRPQWTA